MDTELASPKTDDDIMVLLKEYDNELLRKILTSLYQVYRAMGHSVTEAWIRTLKDHVSAIENTTEYTEARPKYERKLSKGEF